MKKRPMTAREKSYVQLSVSFGCVVCGQEAQFHHLPMARTLGAYSHGYPLCPEHHTGQHGVHGSRLSFEGQHGNEQRLFCESNLKVTNYFSDNQLKF